MGFRTDRWIVSGLAVLAVAVASSAAQSVGERVHSRASGTTIAVLPSGTVDTIVVTPDHRRVAYVAREDGTEFVVFDRRNSRRYSRVGSLTFSPDGGRLAYAAHKDGRALVVIDGVEGKHYDRIDAGPLFSHNGKRIAYVASSGSQSFLVVDGLEGPPSESSPIDDHGLAFSADGVRVARKATANGKQFVMLSDGSHHKYDVVRGRSISFAPHFNRLAYVAGEGGEEFIVEEGRTWKRHPAIVRGPVFASNGTRLAYIARNSDFFGQHFVVVDGIEDKRYDEITSGPVFSPDGKRYAYTARLGQSHVVVIDGREQAKHWSIPYGPLFSPDSQRIAWTVRTITEGREEHRVVVDGDEGTRYRDISIPVFSPDSRRVAYAARTGNEWFMVIDGHEGKKYAVEGRLFSNPLSGPVFTRDSRHVAYAASIRNFDTVIVDGVEGRPAGAILHGPNGSFFFTEFQLRYLFRDGNRVVLNEEFVSK